MGLARVWRDGPFCGDPDNRFAARLGLISPAGCGIDIVKRECGRIGSESWSGSVMFGKHKVTGSERVLSPVFL
ncbi:hypothetical protein J2X36_005444 [Methylobacterium sp. BE186]|nr:hypothetical protein [Methylobacterium sp. BE186]